MRLLGHPVHVMVIHFPIALWPAHWVLHLLAGRLPADVTGAGALWLLTAGTAFGWLAAVGGALDLLVLSRQAAAPRLGDALLHALVNGTVLLGFTLLAGLEWRALPDLRHGAGFLASEGALLAAMLAGNYFGGRVVWHDTDEVTRRGRRDRGENI